MPRVTSKAVSRAIQEATGISGVILWNGGGYHYFTSDEEHLEGFLCQGEQSVYVYRMNDLTVEDWVDRFQSGYAEVIADILFDMFHGRPNYVMKVIK